MPDEQIRFIQGVTDRLLQNLASHAWDAGVKYNYYNATQPLVDIGIALPKRMKGLRPGVGWATRAVNTLGDRLNFDGFANDQYQVNDMLNSMNGLNALDRAKTDALIAGCAFIAIAKKDNGYRLVPFSATEATGEIDENTGRLRYGLAVTEWEGYDNQKAANIWNKVGLVPKDYLVFFEDYTAIYKGGRLVTIESNPTKRPLLHVITHRQSAERPFGKARISNTVRRIVDEVGRLKVRYEVAAEFYSTPQRYINGLAQGAQKDANLDSQIGKVWAITKDEDGEKPEIGQLAQMSIVQFSEQKKDLARDFCAETALTLRNLGYETSNPTSAESLSAMSDDLLLEAQECQKEMGREFREIAITLQMLKYNQTSVPAMMQMLNPSWRPIFQLDLGSAGDALYKLFEIMPELQGSNVAYRMLGMSVQEAEDLAARKATLRRTFMETEQR